MFKGRHNLNIVILLETYVRQPKILKVHYVTGSDYKEDCVSLIVC